MQIEKDKILLIKEYSTYIAYFDSIMQSLVALFIMGISYLKYLSEPNTTIIIFLLFGTFIIISLFIQSFIYSKRSSYIIKGKILSKEETTSRASAISTVQKFKIENNECLEIASNNNISKACSIKKDVFNVHHRLFDMLEEGDEGIFVISGSGMIFALLDEIGNLSQEQLHISWKNKKFEISIIFIAVIIVIGFIVTKFLHF